MKLLLLCLAIGCALVLPAVGFGWVTSDTELIAWLGLSLVFFYASHLPLER